MQHRLIRRIPAIAMGAALAVASATQAQAAIPESDEPIKLAMNEWTGQHISTHVAGEILKSMGYNVEYVTAGYYPQMQALEDNTVGDLGLEPAETWFFNAAAKEKCPGLPSYEALNECAEVFANAETFPQGRLVDYPADWGTTNVDRLKAFELNYTSAPAGSEGALVAEIQGADTRGEPLLVMFWSPHWVHAVVDLEAVELPAYEDGCYEDASVGMNANATYDCDWQRGYIKKMAWKGMADKWPAAAKLLENYTLTNADQIPMMNAIDQEGGKLEEVVAAWMADNEATWKPWVDAASK